MSEFDDYGRYKALEDSGVAERGKTVKTSLTASTASKTPLPADVATIRAACFDALDANTRELYANDCSRHPVTDEEADEARTLLVDLIIARIAQLQQPPFVQRARKEK